MSDVVLVEQRDSVALVTLNRPEQMNAWNGQLEARYFEALEECDRDPDVRAIVVTGAGRAFCVGGDIDLLQDVMSGQAAPPETSLRPLAIRKPLIGALNGAAAGIGLVQALMFDVRFAAAEAKLSFAFARRGLIAEGGASWLLPRIVGMSNALDLLLSSRTIPAEEAFRMGLVNRIVPRETLLTVALDYADAVARSASPSSVAIMKQQLYRDAFSKFEVSVAESDRLRRDALQRPDFAEGIASFLEKREPAFRPLGPPESTNGAPPTS